MDIIKQRYLIKVKPEIVWDALTNPKTIEKWGGGPAKMDDKTGTEFSLWGGDIYGKILEVQNPSTGEKKLVQEWFSGEWELPSIVTITLNYDGDCTEVILIHKDVPKGEVEDINAGWRDFYLGSIKKFLEDQKRPI